MTGLTMKSQRTKDAILATARDQFARSGYERTTVRAIAAAAEIDPAMVIRYFGSKENLFALASEFELELPDLSAVQRDRVGEALIEHFLVLWEGNTSLQVLLRAGVTHAESSERMRGIFGVQLIPVIEALGVDRAHERAALAASQVLGIALCRYVLAFPDVVALERHALIATVGPTLQRYLVGTLPQPAP
jgi:AcrR family transcriptional regulator